MRQKTTVYLDSKQIKAMEAYREKTGVPIARQIRDAINLYLQQKAGVR